VLYTASEGLRVLAVLLNPVMPKAAQKLWSALASDLGSLETQNLNDAGSWGQLKPGQMMHELEALFPRVEEQ
jgi:methionyl-tRNA synthetase